VTIFGVACRFRNVRRLFWRFRRPPLPQHRIQLCAQILPARAADRHVIDKPTNVSGELAIGIGAAVQFGGMGGISRQHIFSAAPDALRPGPGLGISVAARLGRGGMISLAPGTKVFLACQPIELRNRFDGLASKAKNIIQADPFNGHLLA
jgi:hypothetical protein